LSNKNENATVLKSKKNFKTKQGPPPEERQFVAVAAASNSSDKFDWP
jgi:hypothetical protein